MYDRLIEEFHLNTKDIKILSPIEVKIKKNDFQVMCEAAKEIFSLIFNKEYFHLVEEVQGQEITFPTQSNLPVWMIGVDFHLTNEGPKLIEINSNAGGLITSSIWAHLEKNDFLDTMNNIVDSVKDAYHVWSGKELHSIQIVDEDPRTQFTYYDIRLTKFLFSLHSIDSNISDISECDHRFNFIYNRSCDFLLESNLSEKLRRIYEDGSSFVFPNPAVYQLLSDKRSMIAMNSYLKEHPMDYPYIRRVLLECKTIDMFNKQNDSKSGWVFKPYDRFAGEGVFRGKKISNIKFKEISGGNYIAQREARPGTVQYNKRKYKYDVRIFVYMDKILDLSVRSYEGRITNFRSEYGGYSKWELV